MLIKRGLTPEQLQAHYRLNGAPEAFVALVFEAATLMEKQEGSKKFWAFFSSRSK